MPRGLRVLKGLVIALLVAMIGGVIAVVWLLVTQLPQAMRAGPTIPAEIALPEGEAPEAVTFGKGWTLVVTESGRVLVFGTDGAMRQEMRITAP